MIRFDKGWRKREKVTGQRKKQMAAMGKVLVEFGHLEVNLNQSIGWLLSDDIGTGQIVTSRIHSFSARLEIFFSLFKYKASSMAWFKPLVDKQQFADRNILVERAFKFKNKAIIANKHRNDIIHSTWFQQEHHLEEIGSEAPMTGIKPKAEVSGSIRGGKTGLIYKISNFSPNELEQLAKEINALKKEIIELLEDVKKLISSQNH